jgi:hypothetical protein
MTPPVPLTTGLCFTMTFHRALPLLLWVCACQHVLPAPAAENADRFHYYCPSDPDVTSSWPDTCPDGVTFMVAHCPGAVGVEYACPDDLAFVSSEPGYCPDGATLLEAVEILEDGSRIGHTGTTR